MQQQQSSVERDQIFHNVLKAFCYTLKKEKKQLQKSNKKAFKETVKTNYQNIEKITVNESQMLQVFNELKSWQKDILWECFQTYSHMDQIGVQRYFKQVYTKRFYDSIDQHRKLIKNITYQYFIDHQIYKKTPGCINKIEKLVKTALPNVHFHQYQLDQLLRNNERYYLKNVITEKQRKQFIDKFIKNIQNNSDEQNSINIQPIEQEQSEQQIIAAGNSVLSIIQADEQIDSDENQSYFVDVSVDCDLFE